MKSSLWPDETEENENTDLSKDTVMSLSIVVPVYNEQDNVSRLHEEIVQVCSDSSYAFEIIIVDDGSTDRACEIHHNIQ